MLKKNFLEKNSGKSVKGDSFDDHSHGKKLMMILL
jgi:hypothetical protein